MEDRVVVTVEEQSAIIDWIHSKKNDNSFILNQNNLQKFCSINQIVDEEIKHIIMNIKARIIEKEHLESVSSSDHVFLEDFIYIADPGTSLHYHMDTPFKEHMNDDKDTVMVRFNTCIEKPIRGGYPIYDGKLINLVEREYVICKSSVEYHTSEWIADGYKINISFGFLIKNHDLHKYSNRENIIVDEIIISSFVSEQNILLPSSIELDTLITINSAETDFEKNVYNIAKSHSRTTDMTVEYMVTSEHYTFTYEHNKKDIPYMTILYFFEKNSKILFTNVTNDNYKYREINPIDNVFVYIPEENNYVVFTKPVYYRFINCPTKNKILKIRIWNKTSQSQPHVCDVMNNNNNNQYYKHSIYYLNMTEVLLYEDGESIIQKIHALIDEHPKINIFMVKNDSASGISYDSVLIKFGSFAEDIFPFFDSRVTLLKPSNRFIKNLILQNILFEDVCKWIINETFKTDSSNWKERVYPNHATYLNIECLPSVFSFIMFVCGMWLSEVQHRYNIFLNPEKNINITDIFICKTTPDDVHSGLLSDNTFLTMEISLNNIYDGGYIVFEDDDQTIKISAGDMIVYNGKKKRHNYNVCSGTAYKLVVFTQVTM